jgi:hypothetical protein
MVAADFLAYGTRTRVVWRATRRKTGEFAAPVDKNCLLPERTGHQIF